MSYREQINAGKYRYRITIYKPDVTTDSEGFQADSLTKVLEPHAYIKTTKGSTIYRNNSDFEDATTNFTIRFPSVDIKRGYFIDFRGKIYKILYVNNIDEACVELELQAREVAH